MSNGVLAIMIGILPMVLFGSNGYAKTLGKLALPVLVAQALPPLLVAPLIEQLPTNDAFILAGIIGCFSLICLISLLIVSKSTGKGG